MFLAECQFLLGRCDANTCTSVTKRLQPQQLLRMPDWGLLHRFQRGDSRPWEGGEREVCVWLTAARRNVRLVQAPFGNLGPHGDDLKEWTFK